MTNIRTSRSITNVHTILYKGQPCPILEGLEKVACNRRIYMDKMSDVMMNIASSEPGLGVDFDLDALNERIKLQKMKFESEKGKGYSTPLTQIWASYMVTEVAYQSLHTRISKVLEGRKQKWNPFFPEDTNSIRNRNKLSYSHKLYGKMFRIYMDFAEISKRLVAAGLKNYSLIEHVGRDLPSKKSAPKPYLKGVEGFNSINRLVFEKEGAWRGRVVSPDLFTHPFSQLKNDEAKIVTKVMEGNGFFASQMRRKCMGEFLNAFSSEIRRDQNFLSPLDSRTGWKDFSRKIYQSNPENLKTVNMIRFLGVIAHNHMIHTKSYTSDITTLLEALDLFFNQEEVLKMTMQELQICVLHHILFHYFILDLTDMVEVCVAKLHPGDQRIERWKWIYFFKFCLKHTSVQTNGAKTGGPYYEEVNNVMHEELGQRFGLYLLCSQHLQNIVDPSDNSSVQNHISSKVTQDNLLHILKLDKTRPTAKYGKLALKSSRANPILAHPVGTEYEATRSVILHDWKETFAKDTHDMIPNLPPDYIPVTQFQSYAQLKDTFKREDLDRHIPNLSPSPPVSIMVASSRDENNKNNTSHAGSKRKIIHTFDPPVSESTKEILEDTNNRAKKVLRLFGTDIDFNL